MNRTASDSIRIAAALIVNFPLSLPAQAFGDDCAAFSPGQFFDL
jgi:hypothetical protein